MSSTPPTARRSSCAGRSARAPPHEHPRPARGRVARRGAGRAAARRGRRLERQGDRRPAALAAEQPLGRHGRRPVPDDVPRQRRHQPAVRARRGDARAPAAARPRRGGGLPHRADDRPHRSQPDRPRAPDPLRRARRGRRAGGMSAAAASPHRAATQAGAEVLAAGGSAMDAAVAINAMLTVVYPHMCGLAGDLFLLYRDASDGRVWALNGSGAAPRLATREAFRERGLSGVPARGPLPVTVPGAVAAWAAGLERFGRRPLDELLEPAARAAEDGVAITARVAGWSAHNAAALARDPFLRDRFLDAAGAPVAAGTIVRQPELASTLRRLASAGAPDLYRGAPAEEIEAASGAADALLRREDLAAFAPEWGEPVRHRYRGLDVLT